MGQMRLAWPRGARVQITCGHEKHYANGLCAACYARDYRRRVKAYNQVKRKHFTPWSEIKRETGARLSAPAGLTCYNRDSDGVCLGHPYKPGPVYHE